MGHVTDRGVPALTPMWTSPVSPESLLLHEMAAV